jgi:sensor histidine kinase YesM
MLLVKKVVQNRMFLHSLFWTLSYYILLQHFSISNNVSIVDHLFTALFHLSIIVAVYVNLYFLIPRFLNKPNYWKYVISLVVLFLLFYGIHVFTFDHLADFLFPNYYLIVFYDYIELLKYFVVYLGLTSLFVLSKSWIDLAESKKELAEKEKELIHNELKVLKAQVNPHFLFNTLNSIYSLSLQKSEHTPEVILKLSNVLRYMIYESNEQRVPLKKEISFIQNYIELQKLRTKNPRAIKINIDGKVKDQKIAPLILIVFIENAFKHGVKGDTVNQFIHIDLQVSESEIHFVSENNAGSVDETENNEYQGLGLDNVRRRLELLYHENYDLDLSKSSDTFTIDFKIRI